MNSLGGDMPQERLDQIMQAWMKKTGKTEEEWLNFTPIRIPTSAQNDEKNHNKNQNDFDSYIEEAQRMEFIFCPDWMEMGWRYRTKANHSSRLADNAILDNNPVQASNHWSDYLFWNRMSEECFNVSKDIRRKL